MEVGDIGYSLEPEFVSNLTNSHENLTIAVDIYLCIGRKCCLWFAKWVICALRESGHVVADVEAGA